MRIDSSVIYYAKRKPVVPMTWMNSKRILAKPETCLSDMSRQSNITQTMTHIEFERNVKEQRKTNK